MCIRDRGIKKINIYRSQGRKSERVIKKMDTLHRLINQTKGRIVVYFFAVQTVISVGLFLLYIYIMNETVYQGVIKGQQVLYTEDLLGRNSLYAIISFIVYLTACAYYAYHSIIKANAFELFTFLILSTLLTVVSIFRSLYSFDSDHNLKPLVYGLDAVLILNQITYYLIAKQVYTRFRWALFRKIGASPEIHDLYSIYQLFKAMLKLYIVLAICFFMTLFFYENVKKDEDPMMINIVDAVFMVVFILVSMWAYQASRKENKLWMINYFAVLVVFQVYRMIIAWVLLSKVLNPLDEHTRDPRIRNELHNTKGAVVNEVAALFTCCAVLYYGIKLMSAFGLGLKDVLDYEMKHRDATIELDTLAMPRTYSKSFATSKTINASTNSNAGPSHVAEVRAL
eukprot:TRINITY_DN7149_c0_g1_i1.p1 TRINITY_DN7149_c0_g1~~TRINITY_DN7149_c0_g1_i1.p1  ORF type:complete len:413 (+),score=73.31 TRINITY_DN7149_c0_g1_i1:49-1239(+)